MTAGGGERGSGQRRAPLVTDAPPEYVPWHRPSPLLDAIGGFLRHRLDQSRLGFVVDGPKVNARGLLHAGVIAAVGDVGIGHLLAGQRDPPAPLVTVNLSCDLLGPAALGEWVAVTVSPTRVGRRLAAGTATFATTRTIAVVTALFLPAPQGSAVEDPQPNP